METIYIAVMKDSVYKALSFKADGELIDIITQCSEKQFLKWVNDYKSSYDVEIFYYKDILKLAQELYEGLGDYYLPVLCKILNINTENKDELYILVAVILKQLRVKKIRSNQIEGVYHGI